MTVVVCVCVYIHYMVCVLGPFTQNKEFYLGRLKKLSPSLGNNQESHLKVDEMSGCIDLIFHKTHCTSKSTNYPPLLQ